jgi:asparagine synthase (glutamine-hydrolysing)
MCGIWAYIGSTPLKKSGEKLWKEGVNQISARGPEGSRWMDIRNSRWCFTRLAINGLNEGAMQPFDWQGRWAWMCNGEIYNAKQLEEEIEYLAVTGSDCEVLGAVYEHCEYNPVRFARSLDGVFALVLWRHTAEGDEYIVARDPYGVRPLFYTVLEEGGYIFASERKAIEPFVDASGGTVVEFPPGQVWHITIDKTTGITYGKKDTYHEVPWMKQTSALSGALLRDALESAVDKRLMTERPVAALLSGGIDSSLIAALVQKRLKELGKPPLKTFSIGMAGGTDLKYARMVADHIGSDHHEILVTADEMFYVIPQVIRDIESYDITTVRASVGNWMVARAIREKTDCKVVFNGDGSDEVFGSYLYFYKAPSDFAFEEEVRRLLKEIHRYDVLRSDRSISSHGLEARTPFLDRQFVAAAMAYPTWTRRPGGGTDRMEKQLLRDCFNNGLLPQEVLYRKKEAFSDGVSAQEKSWYEIIQEKIKERGLVPEGWREIAYDKNWWPSPPTEEAFYYRQLFEQWYPHTGDLWNYWMPRWTPGATDPSARTLKVDSELTKLLESP